MLPYFYYHPRMLAYDFGPRHPLKPERLRRAVRLLEALSDVEPIDPGPGERGEALRLHDEEYVRAVEQIDAALQGEEESDEVADLRAEHGFWGDNPPFAGMYAASLAYLSGSVRAAEAVRDGAPLAFGIAGGLHHAQRDRASGFCIFDDPAIACHVLRERFDRVAYVDIDVHHGDGVQALFYDDPSVLTCSIHEDGRSLYPGTGFVDETGTDFTALNVPLIAGTTGDIWLDAFEGGILPALARFAPDAIVLQMGTDPHENDPLAHIRTTTQEWLAAVRHVRDLGLPIVALGGGGYALDNVPRMWTAACLTLAHVPYPDALPRDLAEEWGGSATFSDPYFPAPRGAGREHAEAVLQWLAKNHHPNVGG